MQKWLASPSLRGSGLKYRNLSWALQHQRTSPSLRGSGLKYRMVWRNDCSSRRLPLYEGVDWNITVPVDCVRYDSLPLYEGVDWNWCCPWFFTCSHGLPLYEGVDWNKYYRYKVLVNRTVSLFTREWIEIAFLTIFVSCVLRLPLYEGVDWNLRLKIGTTQCGRLPLYEGVDWNSTSGCRLYFHKVSLFTREWIEIAAIDQVIEKQYVSLFTREWIEIAARNIPACPEKRLPLYEGVDWNSLIL